MRNNVQRSFVFLLALLFAATFATAEAGTQKETIRMTIGGGHPSNTMAYTQMAQMFFQPEIAKRVAERTNYQVEWVEGYGGTIAKITEGLLACQDGILDILVNTYSMDNRKLFLMNMPFYIPFCSPDPILATKAIRKVYEDFRPVYDEVWATYNQKFLAFGQPGGYELVTNFPVDKMTDLAGHKIAAAGANLPWLEGSGAIPVQSNLNEAYTCFQTGVYDGWIMFADPTYRFKLHEVAKNYTLIGFGSIAIQGISINIDTWNSLPPEVQAIVLEVSAEYEIKAAQEAKDWDDKAIEFMKNEGVRVTTLAADERAKWVNGLPDIPQVSSKEAEEMGYPGVQIWNAFMNAEKELGYVFPREWVVK